MLPVYAFLVYLFLALAIPLSLALVPVWRRAQAARQVSCPNFGSPALIDLDPWYAVKRHTFGNDEARVKHCSAWREHGACGQECLVRIG